MKSFKVFILATALILCILLIYSAAPSRGLGNELQVSFIDVGQGDSAMIQADKLGCHFVPSPRMLTLTVHPGRTTNIFSI